MTAASQAAGDHGGDVAVKLNGTPIPESGINAAIAGQFGVPMVLVAGDQVGHQLPRRGDDAAGGGGGVELEVDQDVVRIVDGAQDAVAADAGLFAAGWIAVEGPLPGGEIGDGVLDSQDRHWYLTAFD